MIRDGQIKNYHVSPNRIYYQNSRYTKYVAWIFKHPRWSSVLLIHYVLIAASASIVLDASYLPRSGCLLVVIALLIASAIEPPYGYLGNMGVTYDSRLMPKDAPFIEMGIDEFYAFAFRVELLLGALGTLLWGFGDLFSCLFNQCKEVCA